MPNFTFKFVITEEFQTDNGRQVIARISDDNAARIMQAAGAIRIPDGSMIAPTDGAAALLARLGESTQAVRPGISIATDDQPAQCPCGFPDCEHSGPATVAADQPAGDDAAVEALAAIAENATHQWVEAQRRPDGKLQFPTEDTIKARRLADARAILAAIRANPVLYVPELAALRDINEKRDVALVEIADLRSRLGESADKYLAAAVKYDQRCSEVVDLRAKLAEDQPAGDDAAVEDGSHNDIGFLRRSLADMHAHADALKSGWDACDEQRKEAMASLERALAEVADLRAKLAATKTCYEAEIEKQQEDSAHWKQEYDGAMAANGRLATERDKALADLSASREETKVERGVNFAGWSARPIAHTCSTCHGSLHGMPITSLCW